MFTMLYDKFAAVYVASKCNDWPIAPVLQIDPA